jgi:ABC-type polysaccharide/polyol phosphate transport system ATPase subunit
MKSSSTSENPEVLVKVSNVDLVFKTDMYRSQSLRDVFVSATTHPIDFLIKPRDRIHIIKDMSFEIRRGDRVGIIGVNGAGKTTICRCIARMYVPNRGKIDTFGKVRAIFEPGIGVIPELTGRENVELLSKLIYPGDPDRKAIVEEAMKFSELGQFLDIAYKYYSKGMQARLCLSLVSAKPCDVIILDEVFDGADIFFREKMARRVLNLIKESGAALFVSHSPEQVHEVCNRVLLIDHGKIIFDGPVKEGLEKYWATVPAKEMRVDS